MNSTHFYLFSSNGSIAVILPFTVNDIQLLVNATGANGTSNLSISQYATFMSQSVYAIKNLNLSGLPVLSSALNSSIMGSAMKYLSLANQTFYAADAGTYGMVLGNISAVKTSISSAKSSSTFASSAGKYLNDQSTYSLYFAPGNMSSVNYISANISNGNSNFHISFSNSTGLGTFFLQKNGTVNITVSSGVDSLYISLTGNYTIGQLYNYVKPYLLKAGL